MYILAVGRKADDRVSNDLTNAMVCNFAAAIYLKNLDAETAEYFGSSQDSITGRPTPA